MPRNPTYSNPNLTDHKDIDIDIDIDSYFHIGNKPILKVNNNLVGFGIEYS